MAEPKTPLGAVKQAARHFEIISFSDRYGTPCSLQRSGGTLECLTVKSSASSVNVSGFGGPQVKFFLTNSRVMYLDEEPARAIKILNPDVNEVFTLTKRTEKGRKPWWEAAKVKTAAAGVQMPQTVEPPPTAAPRSKTRRSQP